MRLLPFVFIMLISTVARSGIISYETGIAFEDGLTTQLDRLNVGAVYERLSQSGNLGDNSFWDGCDAAGVFGAGALCSLNAASYASKAALQVGSGWNELGVNLISNLAGIQNESLDAQTTSNSGEPSFSSLAGSFQIGFSDEMVTEILRGDNQGIRLGYGFSWLGFGVFDDFAGVIGKWSSMPIVGVEQLSDGRLVRSSLRARVTAVSVDSSLLPVETAKTIFDEVFMTDGEVGMTFPPSLDSYGFSQGEIVSFRLNVEQRLWTDHAPVKVPEPHSIALLIAGLLGMGTFRFASLKAKDSL
ncbi:hypothetical protein [Marinobacter sp. ST-43]|uniref:hypothetical protein n=1 Tax=Marinobacter sp. ST-43 TaxID=3050453 RepID=UPI0026DEED70|nr:hypothetical protein [Marinobacter sp. ST-43]